MSRLPSPGGDAGNWGNVLNDFLSVEHNTDGTLKASGTISTKSDDSTVVHKTGDESVSGVKTFVSSPIIPTPTNATHAANKDYVDSISVSGGAPDATTGTKGLVQLTNHLSGTAAAPTVVGTSLASPLPLNQGGTGANSASAARTSLGLGDVAVTNIDTDPTLAANSDTIVSSQRAVKTYNDTSLLVVPNVQIANYTLVLSDAGKVVELDSPTDVTLTIPTNALVPFPIGVIIGVYQAGAGVVSFAGVGVTIRNPGVLAQYKEGSLRKRGLNEWVLVGAL